MGICRPFVMLLNEDDVDSIGCHKFLLLLSDKRRSWLNHSLILLVNRQVSFEFQKQAPCRRVKIAHFVCCLAKMVLIHWASGLFRVLFLLLPPKLLQ